MSFDPQPTARADVPEAALASKPDGSPFSCGLDALASGQRFTTGGRTITEADVVSFAALTGDRHPQHVDAAWSAAGPFGERVAHGMLVLSYALGLVPLESSRVVALRRVSDAVFKRPARLGDTIHVEGRIDEVRPLDDEVGLVITNWKVLNQDGRTIARARIEVLWRRDRRTAPTPADVDGEPGSDGGLVVPL